LRRVRRRASLILLPLALALALPALAGANAYSEIEHYYFAHNTIPPCKFSSTMLATALGEASTYSNEYFVDISDAIQSALRAQASVRCVHGQPVSSGSLHHYGAPPRSLAPPSGVTTHGDGRIPAPVVLLAILAGLGLLSAGAMLAWRALGLDPWWLASWRHALSEAAMRLGDGVQRRRGP
jgi:hypothetical protein